MKITVVMGAFLPVPPIMGGAVEKIWFALGQEFARRGHDVTQISRRVQELPRRERVGGVEHVRVRGFDAPLSLLWLKVLDLVYSLRVLAVLPRADVIVTNTFWLPVLLRTRRRGAVYVHVTRFPRGQMRLYRHCARLQAPSRVVGEAIVSEVPLMRERVTVIPNPRPEPIHAAAPWTSERERRIIYVGRVHPEKGVHLLVEAFALLPEAERRTWKLVVIGPAEARCGGGGERYLEELARLAQPAGENGEFRGAIFDAAELEREFRRAALFVYPSLAEHGETFGLAPLEAMAQGCPVLVSDLACFHDFIEESRTGFFFDHRAADPRAALSDRVAGLLADELLREQVGTAGYRKSEEYSVARVADQFLADFVSIIHPRNGRAASR